MDGEIYGREGEGRMRNNNVSHLQIGACWKQQRGRLQDSKIQRFNSNAREKEYYRSCCIAYNKEK